MLKNPPFYDGIGVGFITIALLKTHQGKPAAVHPPMRVVTAGFILCFIIPVSA